VIERPCTSASNRARRISEGRSAAKAKWEADKCSKHFGYRLKGKAGTKRPIPMTSVKSLAARFYRLKSGHAPTGVYLKRFGHPRERVYTSAGNRTRRISEAKTAAKAEWEADKCSKHHGYRLKGKAGSKRLIPMNSVKPLAARFYRLKSGHAPVDVPETVRTPRRRQVLVVRRGGPDTRISLPPLQPVESPAENALERGGESNGMESGQMPTRASL
jgi:hypothetical protein